jgi:hypothetical protein
MPGVRYRAFTHILAMAFGKDAPLQRSSHLGTRTLVDARLVGYVNIESGIILPSHSPVDFEFEILPTFL